MCAATAGVMMARILVAFHSTAGHVYRLAAALAEGVRAVGACEAIVKQVPETISAGGPIGPDYLAKRAAFADLPVADPDELDEYDGIAFGTPVHLGGMSSAMRTFLDQTGDLWVTKSLIGRPATVFVSAGTGAGRETAILSVWHALAIHGMVIVPVGMRPPELSDMQQVHGGSPLGAGSITSGPGERPSEQELRIAEAQGFAFAEITRALAGQ